MIRCSESPCVVRRRVVRCLWLVLVLAVGGAESGCADGDGWKTLAPGLELLTARALATERTDAEITVLRIDPEHWELSVHATSHTGDASGRSATEWSREHGLVAAINAGMFATDYATHVGYLRIGEHVNNGSFNKYQSVAAFGRRKDGIPHFRIFDLDAPGTSRQQILRDYSTVIQNLRLIKRPGENRWAQNKKSWSEAALGEDSAGRALFIYSTAPFTMHDFNRELLALDLDLVAAQHLEGGTKAQLFLNAGGVEREMYGSFETSDPGNGGLLVAFPIPFVLGVRARSMEDPS